MSTDTELNLGQVIKDSGDFGRFQIMLYACVVITLHVLTWSMLTMAFTASVPDWQCIVNSHGQNNTGNWTEANVCNIKGISCDAFIFDNNMRTAVSEWELVCDKKWISQTITTIQMSGLLVGGLLWGHVSDGWGRKPTFFLNMFLLGAFNAVSYFSVSWEMFAAMRFGIGFCSAGFMMSSVSFEYIRNKWRLYLWLFPSWAVWASAMAGFCWWLPDWRYIHVVIAAVAAPCLLLWFFIPESFRWLISHGRVDEAEAAIQWVARVNGKPTPDLSYLKATLDNEKKLEEKTLSAQVYTVLDLFKTPYIRKTTLLFAFIWLFSAYSYYGIAFGIQELSGNLYLNLLLINIVDVPGNWLMIIFNTCGGRRWTCVGFYALSGAFAVAVGIIQYTGISISGQLLNGLAFAAKLCVAAAWDINTLWSSESFPTVVRNIGGGFISSVSRVGSMIAPQIITLSMDIPGLLYFASGVACVASAVMSGFLEETKNKDLSDVMPDKGKVKTDIN